MRISDWSSDVCSSDLAKRTKLRTIDLSPNRRPHGLLWLSDGRLVATTEGSASVAVVAPAGDLTSIATEQKGPHMLAVAPANAPPTPAKNGAGTVRLPDRAEGTNMRATVDVGQPTGVDLATAGSDAVDTER